MGLFIYLNFVYVSRSYQHYWLAGQVKTLDTLAKHIGIDKVIHEHESRTLYPCPSQAERHILGVAKPHNIKDVQAIVDWANTHHIKLYPLSTGRNWGYGGGNPVEEDCLIVDMGDMDQIRNFDPDLGSITLQPGVTQGDLYHFLTDHSYPFFAPVTGSSPHCSLIGNALERGYGVTPITDHFQGITEVKAVLADGSIYQGQLDQMGVESSKLAKWGAGPYVEGLFSQGNFGIVVEATIKLEAKTDHSIMIIFKPSDDAEDFEQVVRISRELMQTQKKVVSAIKYFNKAYSVALNMPVPRDELAAPDFDITAWLNDAGKKHRLPEWLGLIFIYGNDDLAHIAARECKKRLAPHCKSIVIFDRKKIKLARAANKILPNIKPLQMIKAQIDTVSASYDLLRGMPQSRFLKAAYWRAGELPDNQDDYHPGRDGCGLIWYAPMLPMTGKDLLKFEQITKDVCARHGIFPVVSMTTISEQCITALVPIMFDPATESEQAFACHKDLFESCQAAGYLPYRAHIDSMAWYGADNQTTHFQSALQKAKQHIDADGLMSPGRYQRRKA
ncbi:MAG: FAD-binding oxidoreductase [Alphaproteobacteria bacterium]